MIAVALLMSGLLAFADAANVPVQWRIPSNRRPYPTTYINVGDTVTFSWTGLHGVYALANGPASTCPTTFQTTGPAVLAASAPTGTYTWAPTAPGTYNLACQVGDHCTEGMLIQLVVGNGPALAPGAQAPMVPSTAPAAPADSDGV